MFNIGFSELIILGVIALLFIGPKELPEIARTIGRFLNELKRTTGDLTSTMMRPQERFRDELQNVLKNIEQPLQPHDGDKLPMPPAEEAPWSHDNPVAQPPAAPSTATQATTETKNEKPKGDA